MIGAQGGIRTHVNTICSRTRNRALLPVRGPLVKPVVYQNHERPYMAEIMTYSHIEKT